MVTSSRCTGFSKFGFKTNIMQTLFNDKPVMLTLVKIGIVAFIGLSLVNLYYSIKVNRALLEKAKE